jgi:two-component system chemotaxis sensor kinase CheA
LLAELTAAQAANAGGTAAPAPQPKAKPAKAPKPPPEPAAEAQDAPNADLDIDLDAMLDDLAGAMGGSSPEAESADDDAEGAEMRVRPHAGAMRNGSEPVLMLREAIELGGRCELCDISEVPPLDKIDPETGYLGWHFSFPADVTETAVRDIFDFIGDECDLVIGRGLAMPPVQLPEPKPGNVAPAAPAPASAAVQEPPRQTCRRRRRLLLLAANQTIRIELGKLDRLIDAVGELVIAQAMMAQRLVSEGVAATEELTILESLTRDIQESAMSIRAQPIGSVFSRVPRILRELTQSTGKHVRLDVSGESTELDKTVIERLGEPLTHLIRNAVDHGIEESDQRVAAGKSPEGTLTLSAEHRSSRIVIRIADDGRGIDRERVLAKAIEKGLVPADVQLSKEEIDQLIFAPGFSTAQTVSNISGRGVGMDVVRQNVKDLGGRITIESEPGKGTAFILTMPLTLAISDGMVVNVGDQTLVIPLANVVESLRPDIEQVKGLGTQRAMINVRGRFIPIIPLHASVGAVGAKSARSRRADRGGNRRAGAPRCWSMPSAISGRS